MARTDYLQLAASGQPMVLGTHLVLHEQEDAASAVMDGERLGQVILQAAERFDSPLAMPLMDLELEKLHLLALLGVETDDPATWHMEGPAGPDSVARLEAHLAGPLSPRMEAVCGAIRHVARRSDRLPTGMCIGPFSLVTKLLADPITPVAMAGMGLSALDDPDIALLQQALELAVRVLERYIEAQAAAAAKVIILCEPAANVVYFSPNQMDAGSDIFDRFVLGPNRRLKAAMDRCGVDLFLHDCGELTETMVRELASLEPVILSLGSSRKLWEDAALVPDDVVLFGNLPSKRFYSDTEITRQQVSQMASELAARMAQTGHPFILGSECDVLSVPGCEHAILGKVEALLAAGECADCGRMHGGAELEAVAAG
jgi:uroporphyrinogen-III decarboxylase